MAVQEESDSRHARHGSCLARRKPSQLIEFDGQGYPSLLIKRLGDTLSAAGMDSGYSICMVFMYFTPTSGISFSSRLILPKIS